MPLEDRSWATKVCVLRNQLNLSQEDLAVKLKTNQCTISRWERGATTPNFRMRVKLEELFNSVSVPEKLGMDIVAETAQVLFDCGNSPALLLHCDGTVMAVSSDNEYHPGLKYQTGIKLRDQTLQEDMEKVVQLDVFLNEVGFWDTVNRSFEFSYQSRDKHRCVILTSIEIDSETYCLMQKK
jgi:transcriptional regulator with XRE-family HTH domain